MGHLEEILQGLEEVDALGNVRTAGLSDFWPGKHRSAV